MPPERQPGGAAIAGSSAPPASRLPGPAALWLLATAWFALNAASQRLFSATAETDQAAELVRSQLWQWGYGSQPPLYTWLARLLLELSGPALWPLLVLKVAILSALVASLLQIGRLLRFSPAQQAIAVAGIALIPQFAWESQRDLTHSVLATLLAALTLLQLLRLQRSPTAGHYALAGVLGAGGMLSKYTFGVFLLGALLAGLSLPAFRRRLLDARMLIALAVGAGLLAPHLLWALGQPDLALGGLDKLQAGPAFPIAQLRGLASAAWTAIAFLTPLWIVGLVLVAKRLQPPGNPGQRLLARLPLAIAVVLTLVILVSGATRIKDRWYQNLLFYAPVLLAVLSGPAPPSRRLRLYLQSAGLAAAAVSVALPARIPLAGALGRTSALNEPVVELLGRIRERQQAPVLVIASDSFLGGNARRVFPDVPVLPAQALQRFEGPPLAGGEGLVLLLASAETKEGRGLPGLLEGLEAAGLQAPEPGSFTAVTAPARWAPRERYTLFVQALPAHTLAAASPRPSTPGAQPSAADPER
ncbi:glycosyltransferase family 39 protein [Cyanobium sp. CH-040]|uniref:glycosyltransferase family 39 protein n=1 Tax=Cyanobium sp. CH-040 TaxID=2823708 RepID=UPI0020CD7367|nr:glycosyltransferase family 39 protein [Cyanobium sp. CH-040]MCP9928279.1 glycosyltransferase family 39 protein [Cyanobium sp. CH-040]